MRLSYLLHQFTRPPDSNFKLTIFSTLASQIFKSLKNKGMFHDMLLLKSKKFQSLFYRDVRWTGLGLQGLESHGQNSCSRPPYPEDATLHFVLSLFFYPLTSQSLLSSHQLHVLSMFFTMANFQRLVISALLILTAAFLFMANGVNAARGPKITNKVRDSLTTR